MCSRDLLLVYHLVDRPVIDRLHELSIPEQSRMWWCPTSVLFSSSYTPALSALIESWISSSHASGLSSLLPVAWPDASRLVMCGAYYCGRENSEAPVCSFGSPPAATAWEAIRCFVRASPEMAALPSWTLYDLGCPMPNLHLSPGATRS